MPKCFECGSERGCVNHHVVPRVVGGTKTVCLCAKCNAKVHSVKPLSISALTKKALALKRSRNEKTGGDVPYGYGLTPAGILIKNETEQRVLKTIRRLNRDGYSLRKICRELERGGYSTKRGNPVWHPSVIWKILNRKAYDDERISR